MLFSNVVIVVSYQKFKCEPGHVNGLQQSKGWIISLIVVLISLVKIGQSVEGQNHGRQDDESYRDDCHHLDR